MRCATEDTASLAVCLSLKRSVRSSSGVILGESYSKKPRGLGKAWLHPLFAPGLIAESRTARVWDIIRFIRSSFSLRCRSLISRITYHQEKKARIQRDGCVRELTLYCTSCASQCADASLLFSSCMCGSGKRRAWSAWITGATVACFSTVDSAFHQRRRENFFLPGSKPLSWKASVISDCLSFLPPSSSPTCPPLPTLPCRLSVISFSFLAPCSIKLSLLHVTIEGD